MIPDLLRRITPTWVKDLLRRRRAETPPEAPPQETSAPPPAPPVPPAAAELPSCARLRDLMRRYTVEHLVNAGPDEFKRKIDAFLALTDHASEGFIDADRQRDLSIRFHWGHDHDFGDFRLAGWMRERHLSLLATFMDRFGTLPNDLTGLRVLDVGCWTGGTSLILAAMGAEVVAIDEVHKYVDCLNYMRHAFDLRNLEPRALSLYECTTPEFRDAFDIVLFAGVLYHLTDPVLALRITFDCLVDGGVCLVETAAVDSPEPILSYEGPSVFRGGSKEDLSRSGWNWFFPSATTLERMMTDVGFTSVRVSDYADERLFASGTRHHHVDMTRAGLSVRDVY